MVRNFLFFIFFFMGIILISITFIPALKTNQVSRKTYDFVGPICESTDKFTTLKKFQKLKEKDLIIMCDVGAYGMSLSSNYNVRPKPIEILIRGSKVSIIKKRQKLIDLM